MFWLVMPIIVNDNREVSWNMFFGSFLGLVAITFVVSMKGSFVAFKASFFQYNCCNKVPQLQVSESLQAQYREKKSTQGSHYIFVSFEQGSQIRQIWRILHQNCSDDSTEVREGVTSTPEIFGNKHSFVLTSFATNTIYVNCKRCKP